MGLKTEQTLNMSPGYDRFKVTFELKTVNCLSKQQQTAIFCRRR
jgi:hypothetical protein